MRTESQNEAWNEAHSDFFCVCLHQGYLHDDGEAACIDCACKTFRPVEYVCKRWGTGPDQCVLPSEHLGPCVLFNGSNPAHEILRAYGLRG